MASVLQQGQVPDGRGYTSLPCTDAPSWVLRHHSPCAITALSCYKGSPADYNSTTANQASNSSGSEPDSSSSEDEDDSSREDSFLLVGDATGKVSLTSLRTHRPLLHWQAHRSASSILGVQAWMERGYLQILTHGRDNSIKIWKTTVHSEQQRRRQEAYTGGRKEDSPELILSLDVNALNFCRFSVLVSSLQGLETLLAVPHTVESGYIDLYQLPAKRRLYSSIGSSSSGTSHQAGRNRPAIVMSMHLFRLPSIAQKEGLLGIVAGYEDGTLQVWIEPQSTGSKQDIPSSPWRCLWKKRLHAESILSIDMRSTSKKDGLEVVSVGADDRICYVEFPFEYLQQASRNDSETIEPRVVTNKTDKPGRGSCAFLSHPLQASQGVSFVVGGWDGRGRIYRVDSQTGEMSCQGVLRYHREDCSVQAVAAGQASRRKGRPGDRAVNGEQGFIALGGKDGRVSLWL